MTCSKFIIRMLTALTVLTTTTATAATDADSIPSQTLAGLRYEQRIERARERWAQLIPTHYVIQNAGNMGFLSVGTGWDYAHGHLSTQLLLGYIPQHQSTRGKLTMTLKQNYTPFHLRLGDALTVQPLTLSFYLNTVYGHEFWKTQPRRYPSSYYEFMSTKFRLNVAVGQQITRLIPQERRRLLAKSVTLFYELSTCDLYLRSRFIDRHVALKDIVGLSVGARMQIF